MAPVKTPPAFSVLVLYPRSQGTFFNLDYYLKSHIPLAEKHWGPFGMTFHAISEYGTSDDFHLSCLMDWESKEAYEEAQKDGGTKIIMDDVTSGRITNVTPIFLAATVAR